MNKLCWSIPKSLFLQPSKGDLSEWLKEHAWKVCILQKGIEGSNPSLSASWFSERLTAVGRKWVYSKKGYPPGCFRTNPTLHVTQTACFTSTCFKVLKTFLIILDSVMSLINACQSTSMEWVSTPLQSAPSGFDISKNTLQEPRLYGGKMKSRNTKAESILKAW